MEIKSRNVWGIICHSTKIFLYACNNLQVPDNGFNHLADRLLLFRHDYNSNNVLQMINSPTEIVDETLVEIVLTANRKCK